MKLLIAGSRDFIDYEFLETEIYKRYSVAQFTAIISGGARGADSLADEFAYRNDIPFELYKADWSKGKQAGILRTITMVDASDEVVVFWDGKSKGSLFTINYSKEKNKLKDVILVKH